MGKLMSSRKRSPRDFARNERGVAAVEFALILPALAVVFMGILEMALRFRAAEETTRYTYQIADLVARDDSLTTADLKELHNASVFMMKPVGQASDIDLDISAIGFQDTTAATPYLLWRRVAGTGVPLTLADANGLGLRTESVLRVGVRYKYNSPLTSMFGGSYVPIVRQAWARPRETRVMQMDGVTSNNGQTLTF
jgi:Flp pilus assembly protein TadG